MHSAIYLTALFIFLAIILIRFTLYCCFRELHHFCCKKFKSYLRPDEVQSDNVYKELSMKNMLKEYDKTREEIARIEGDKRVEALKDKLGKKKKIMEDEMRRRLSAIISNS